MKSLLSVIGMVLLGIPLTFCVTFGEDTPGINYHFSHADDTGTRSSSSYNPSGPGNGMSYTFDSGNTLNSDGSYSYRFGNNDGNGITYRTEPAYGDD